MAASIPTRAGTSSNILSAAAVGMSLVREGVGDVPIAKQIVGVVGRIVEHSEKINKSREALHELAAEAKRHCDTIREALECANIGDRIAQSLGRIHQVLLDIEAFMKRFRAKGRVRRAASYILAVPQEVERMTREMSNVFKEFHLIASIELADGMKENARYHGQFHRLVESDVRDGDVILEHHTDDGTPVVRYIRAHVHGELVVVRLLNPDVHTDDVRTKALVDRAILQDDILRGIRLWDRHRNVARIYGWGDGNVRQRFTALVSGSLPICDRNNLGDIKGVDYFMQTTAKLLEASRHLETKNIMWDPEDVGSVFVDEHGEPTIGLANDFKLGTSAAPTESYTKQLIALRWIADRFAEFEIVHSEEEITRYLTRQDTRVSELVASAGVTARMTQLALLKSDIDSTFGRGPAIAQLDKAFSAAPYCNCPLSRVPAADMLFMLLPKYHFKTRANYFASGCQTGTDLLLISSVIDNGTALRYQRLELKIDNSHREETRAMLGITVPVFGDERDENMMGYVPSLSSPGHPL